MTSLTGLNLPPQAVPRPLKFLFLNTRPLTDLVWAFYLLPVWWLIGLEQFVWPILLGWGALKCINPRTLRLRAFPAMGIMFAFMIFALLSSLNIVESRRVIAFIRTYSHYVAAFSVLIILANDCRNREELMRVLYSVVTAMGISALVSLAAATGYIDVNFRSLIGNILPDSIQQTQIGREITRRTLGGSGWFVYVGRYFRATGFLLFSTYYGTALMVTIPIMAYVVGATRGRWLRMLMLVFLVAAVLNLLLTTARVAIIGCVIGAIYCAFALNFWKQRRLTMHALVLTILFGLGVALGGFLLYQDQIMSTVGETVNSVLYARGAGSVNSRTQVYVATIEGWLERPWLGWGTERDVEGLSFPAGSHSHYLAMLYRYGVIGLLLFFVLCAIVWVSTAPPKRLPQTNVDVRLLFYGRWVLVALAINSLTTASDVDAIVMVLVWTIIGSLIIYRKRLVMMPDYAPKP